VLALLTPACFAQNSSPVSLDTSESLFAVLTAINACGFDTGLDSSLPVRTAVRNEAAKNIQSSPDGPEVTQNMCHLYDDHKMADPTRTLAEFVSLALYLNPPPALSLKAKEGDIPPDATAVEGILPALQKYAELAGLHSIWLRHQLEYERLTAMYHAPVSKMMFDTGVYLKLPSSEYLGRGFTVLLDPMGAPGETNARNYGSDYYVVVTPGRTTGFKMEQIRHTYLHYLIDPLDLKYPEEMKRLQPLLASVKTSPMDASFRHDTSLLVTECLIRAVEARLTGSGKGVEPQRQQAVEEAEEQGYILTGYFYNALQQFEKDPAGLKTAFEDMLAKIDVHREQKAAAEIRFAAKADPEVLRLSEPQNPRLLQSASLRLSVGDTEGAQKLAQEALNEKSEDAGQALFIMAEAATMNRDMPNARKYFQQALQVAHEPKVVAWSHIYLGRISDLQDDRNAALDHYRAALSAGAYLPEAKAAAERGIQQPYEPPNRPPVETPPAK
jgi:tetratricopeptide (TPR) repeat protein